MKVAYALLCLVLFILPSTATFADDLEAVRATAEDVEMLVAKKKWSDAVFTLRDVPAGSRGKKWDALVEKTVVGYLGSLQASGGSGTELVASRFLKEYPSLLRGASFLKVRKEVGLKAFEACFDLVYDDQDCGGRFLSYVEETPGDVAFALQAADLVSRKDSAPASLPFRSVAIRWSSTPVQICREAGTRRAILAALHLPEGPLLNLGHDMAAKTCAKEAKSEIDSEFEKTKKGSFIANACRVFKTRGDGPVSAAARCVVGAKSGK